jgi:hypothetical protein
MQTVTISLSELFAKPENQEELLKVSQKLTERKKRRALGFLLSFVVLSDLMFFLLSYTYKYSQLLMLFGISLLAGLFLTFMSSMIFLSIQNGTEHHVELSEDGAKAEILPKEILKLSEYSVPLALLTKLLKENLHVEDYTLTHLASKSKSERITVSLFGDTFTVSSRKNI